MGEGGSPCLRTEQETKLNDERLVNMNKTFCKNGKNKGVERRIFENGEGKGNWPGRRMYTSEKADQSADGKDGAFKMLMMASEEEH